jgi:DnaK suppressor protein
MDRKEIEQLKQRLEQQREEILPFLSRLEQETRSLQVDSNQDSADQCVLTLSKESLFERSSQRRTLLRLVEAALERISNGSFGICVGCGEEIQIRRLKALPWTQFCLQCQEELEQEVGASVAAQAPTGPAGNGRRAGYARPL